MVVELIWAGIKSSQLVCGNPNVRCSWDTGVMKLFIQANYMMMVNHLIMLFIHIELVSTLLFIMLLGWHAKYNTHGKTVQGST